jgi:hypothetical protein
MGDELALSPEAEKVLLAAGWTPERQVDPSYWTDVLQTEGYVFSPAAEQILASFGGLAVRPPTRPELSVQCSRFHFDPVASSSGEFDRFEDWEALAQRPLAPIGEVGLWILCADADGGVYIGSHGDLEAIGPLERALDYLCMGRGKPLSLS